VGLELIAQRGLLYLAGWAMGDGVDEYHVIGQPPSGDPAFHELQDSKGRSCINPSIITLLKPRTARRAIVID
jgi:hypothetical protein